MTGVFLMSHRDCHRIKILSQIDKGDLTYASGAKALDLGERQVYTLMRRYRKEGDQGVIHRLRGRPSNRGYPTRVREYVVGLFQTRYADYGPTLFCEQLEKATRIRIDHETVRRWLIAAGQTVFSRKRRRHRSKRLRRSAMGALVQFDGSYHDWFEGRGDPCCLLHAIDDASGRIFLRFAPSENTVDCMRVLQEYCRRYGMMGALYTDRHAVYDGKGKVSALGQALSRAGIELILAHSPQAKGRVERGNRTHQDRLIKALRCKDIGTITEANRYLEEEYVEEHNRRFAHVEGIPDVHRNCAGIELRNVFCFQTRRQVHADYTITLGGCFIQLERSQAPLPPPKCSVIVRRWLDGSVHIFWHEVEVASRILEEAPVKRPKVVLRPAANHPWRGRLVGTGSRGGGTPLALRAPSVPPPSARVER